LAQFAGLSTVCALIVLNGVSNLLAETDPGTALVLNPFNTNASVNLVVAGLSVPDPASPGDLRTASEAALRSAPGDARLYSMLGAVYDRDGQGVAAETLYDAALSHSRTEIHALLSKLQRSIGRADYVAALGYADTSLRRWPNYREQVLPAFPVALADPAARTELARMLSSQTPPWRGTVIQRLLQSVDGLVFVRELLLAEVQSGKTPGAGEVGATISALVNAGAPGPAYQFFLLTMDAEERAVSGYVHDARFTRPPRARYFGWNFRSDAAADVSFPAPDGGLRLRFLDSPARLGNLTQTLRLPAGDYRMEVVASTIDLRAPKGLFWRLRCRGGAALAELDTAAGTYDGRSETADFTVPASGCPLQSLTLATNINTGSWRDRYSGTVTFEAVDVTRR